MLDVPCSVHGDEPTSHAPSRVMVASSGPADGYSSRISVHSARDAALVSISLVTYASMAAATDALREATAACAPRWQIAPRREGRGGCSRARGAEGRKGSGKCRAKVQIHATQRETWERDAPRARPRGPSPSCRPWTRPASARARGGDERSEVEGVCLGRGATAGLDTRAKKMSTRQRRHHPSLGRPHCQTLYETTHLPDRLHFIPPWNVLCVFCEKKRERKRPTPGPLAPPAQGVRRAPPTAAARSPSRGLEAPPAAALCQSTMIL
jgi:hypothetical protein